MLRLTWTLCSGCLSCSRWSRWWWGPLSRGSPHWPQPPVSRRQNWRSCREKRVSWHLECPHVHGVRRTSSQTILEEFSWFSSYLSNICEWTKLRVNNISWYRLEGTKQIFLTSLSWFYCQGTRDSLAKRAPPTGPGIGTGGRQPSGRRPIFLLRKMSYLIVAVLRTGLSTTPHCVLMLDFVSLSLLVISSSTSRQEYDLMA